MTSSPRGLTGCWVGTAWPATGTSPFSWGGRSRAGSAGPGTPGTADLRRDVTRGEHDHVPHPADAVALRAQRGRADIGVQGVPVIGDHLVPACPGDQAERIGEGVGG